MHEETQEPTKQQTQAPASATEAGAAPARMPAEPTSPHSYAEKLRASPASMAQVLGQLHQTHGNSFVQQVLAELQQSSGGGKPLPAATRVKMEQAFGTDLSAIRVHQDGAADATGAEAYARGTDIHFAAGKFDPGSTKGQELIGHEVAHVVQQSEGRASGDVQNKGGAVNGDPSLEREADQAGAGAANGQAAGIGAGATVSAAAPATPIQQKTTINPIAATMKTKDQVLGDGTPGNPGLTITELEAYTTKQADWFTEPSLTAADREAVWKVVNLFHYGPHMASSLAAMHTGELAALPSRQVLSYYTDGFNPAGNSIQLSTTAPTLAKALQLGQAMKDLAAFVPGAVLRHVIPESGLQYMMTAGKIPDLEYYYKTFRPSLEKPEEWTHVEDLLREGVRTNAVLADWISELHIFTRTTRSKLKANITDKSKTKPVLLVVMSALDWNTAFLQGANVEQSVTDPHNLGLVVQGRTLGAATAHVSRVAKDYGKGGKLGQVVLAGHGSDTSMEMGSDHTEGWWDAGNNRVAYDKPGDVDTKNKPDKNGTQELIDTILTSLDPATANLVFAGCLINSHDIDPSKSKLTGPAAAIERRLRANIKAHPNLADYVKSRMTATGTTVEMHAANASTGFSTFSLDPGTGKAQLSDTTDPDIGGTKLGYVRTGTEPEGVLRAALECCADEKIGIASTTAEMDKRVKALAGATSQGESCVRVAFELALHKGAGKDVDVAMLADLVHRMRDWGEAYADTPAQRLADAVKKSEAAKIFPALLAVGYGDDVNANYYQSWMKFDPSQAPNFMAKLGSSGMAVEQFKLQLSRKILDPHLATLLPISAAPTQAQMLLALTIADGDGSVPSHVREFLIKAAGGKASRAFPAALNVGTLFPNGEGRILERIGLTDKAPPAPGGTIDGNVDLNHDGKNESHIDANPHKATVTADVLNVRKGASPSSHVIGTLKKDAVVRVAGSTQHGHWSMIDFDGSVGFANTHYLKQE